MQKQKQFDPVSVVIPKQKRRPIHRRPTVDSCLQISRVIQARRDDTDRPITHYPFYCRSLNGQLV